MPYGALIREAFRIAGGHRYLWPFGLFAGGTFNFNFRFSGDLDVDPGVLAAIVAAMVVLGLVFLVLGTLSHGALPQAVAAIWGGERPGFRVTLRAGASSFWRVLGFGALFFAILLAIFAAVVIPLALVVGLTFAVTDAGLARGLAIAVAAVIAFVVLIVVFLPAFAIGQFGLRERVLGGRGAVESLRRSGRLIRANLAPSLLMILIQQGIAIGATLVLGFGLLLLAVPAIVILAAVGGAAGIVAVAVTALVVLPLGFAGFGAIGAFGHSLWTLAWMRLTWRQPAPSERPY